MHIVTDSLKHAEWLTRYGQELLKNSPGDTELIVTYKETISEFLGENNEISQRFEIGGNQS